MNFERIKELIELAARSPIGELEITEDGVTVRIGRARIKPDSAGGSKSGSPAAAGLAPLKSSGGNAAQLGSGDNEIIAPLFGLVRRTPAPGAPPFVTVGDRVAEGQTVCLIEAMKVFTPVVADRAGTIAEILAEDGQEIEVGQPLLRFADPAA